MLPFRRTSSQLAASAEGQVGAVTGVVGAAGGLGGFFPPLVMGAVYGALGSYAIGFLLLAATAAMAGVFTATAMRNRTRISATMAAR